MNTKKNTKKPVKKHAQYGGYVYKPIISIIVLCECGNKYIKTRDNQIKCVRCINKNKASPVE